MSNVFISEMFCSKAVFFIKTSSFCSAVSLTVCCCCKQFFCRWFVPQVLHWMNDFCCTTIIMGGCCGQWRAEGGCVMAVAACLGLYCCVSCIQHKCYNTRQKCFSKTECDTRDSCATTSSGSFKYFSHSLTEWRGVSGWRYNRCLPMQQSFYLSTWLFLINRWRKRTLSSFSYPAILIKPRRTSKDGCDGFNPTISHLASLGAMKPILLFPLCAWALVSVRNQKVKWTSFRTWKWQRGLWLAV